jgi:hypothetical protein
MESGVYVIVGALVGGLFTFLSAQRTGYVSSLEKELAKVKRGRDAACQQIKAYYQLECRYAAEVSTMLNQSEQTVRIRFRNDIESEIGIRPSWTARDAEKELSEL